VSSLIGIVEIKLLLIVSLPEARVAQSKAGAFMVAGSIIASSTLGLSAYFTHNELEVPGIQNDSMESICRATGMMGCAQDRAF
jgi:hypothetical protein